jgi:hypothetical protein
MTTFDDNDDISVIGTGAEARCSGRSEVKKLFLRNFRDAHVKRFKWGWIRAAVNEILLYWLSHSQLISTWAEKR